MFKPVSSRLNLTLLEEEMLRHWKSHRIFEKSAARRQGAPAKAAPPPKAQLLRKVGRASGRR